MAPMLRAVVVAVLTSGLAVAAEGATARRVRVAVMEMRPLGTEEVKAELLSEVALTEASRFAGLEVIGRSDIAGIVGFEKQKAMLGCGDELSCVGDLAGALGVDYLLLGSLGRLGTLYRVDLKLVDARKVRVLARAGESVSGDEEKLVATVQRGVRELLSPVAPGAKVVAAAASAPFDGRWLVKLDCPETPAGVRGYTQEFEGTVAGGTFLATHGAAGAPASLRLEGVVSPDGSAYLTATGFTGGREYAVNRAAPGTPLRYHVKARFESERGTGARVEHRPCSFTFTRR